MKRLRRWLFNFAAAVSLGGCLLGIAAWIGGMSTARGIQYSIWSAKTATYTRYVAVTDQGYIRLAVVVAHWDQLDRESLGALLQRFPVGFSSYSARRGSHSGWWLFQIDQNQGVVEVHASLFLVGSFLLPILWTGIHVLKKRAESRQISGRCGHCGYDLRATPNRCPECGAIPDDAKLLKT